VKTGNVRRYHLLSGIWSLTLPLPGSLKHDDIPASQPYGPFRKNLKMSFEIIEPTAVVYKSLKTDATY
jgi:hypothetical protein